MSILKYGVVYNGVGHGLGYVNSGQSIPVEYPVGTRVANISSPTTITKSWNGKASRGNLKIGSTTKQWANKLFRSDLKIIASLAEADGYAIFTSGSGTWIVPAEVTSFTAYIIGGGGGGGGSEDYTYNSGAYRTDGGGGGGGGYLVSHTYTNQTPGTSYNWSVGAGGSGGSYAQGDLGRSATNGNRGGTSTFGAYSANGGYGGGASGGYGGDGGSGGGLGAWMREDAEGLYMEDGSPGCAGGTNGGHASSHRSSSSSGNIRGRGDSVSKYVTYGGSTHLFCGGGGGGAGYYNGDGYNGYYGGDGGGGRGSGWYTPRGPVSGTANTGGGGGGGAAMGSGYRYGGASGGSGIIILVW